MSLQLSSIVKAQSSGRSGHFSAHRLNLEGLGQFAAPVMGFDHYRMSGPTFAPHPHAGFSAISYIFEDSEGGLRNRDSLQNDLVIEPGAMVWTQAGSGVVHDEFPAQIGQEVHGVQIFVNLASQHKDLPPRMLHVAAADVPVVSDVSGNRTRVLSGRFAAAISPLDPAEPADLLDVRVNGTWSFTVSPGHNILVYALRGGVEVRAGEQTRTLGQFEAVAGRSVQANNLNVTAREPAQVLVLSGTDPAEPIAAYGPFIMNNEAQLAAAFERYRRGEMGRLTPLGRADH